MTQAAVDEALEAVAGAERLHTAVTVLPDGDVVSVHLQWDGLGERDLRIPLADCPQAPALIALATERALAEIPGGLHANPAAWRVTGGVELGAGPTGRAARLGGWARAAHGPDLQLVTGLSAAVGSEALGPGAIRSAWVHGHVGPGWTAGPALIAAELLAGGVLATGVDLANARTTVRPRIAARVGADLAAGRVRLGLAVEAPVLGVAWVVDGAGSASEPVVRVAARLGIGAPG